MGYVRLNFPNTGTVPITTVLHDIVGCVTGRFSSSVQLQGALTGSEIINNLNQNWNFAHPTSSSFINNTPNNALSSWVLTAPCINPSKTKYIRLVNAAKSQNNLGPQIGSTGNVAGNLYNVNPAGTAIGMAGVLMQACLSASNATTLISGSWYATNTPDAEQDRWDVFTGNQIIVSWSSRHFIMWSNAVARLTPNYLMMAYIEFPETEYTIGQNLVPAYLLIERNGGFDSFLGSYNPSSTNSGNNGDILVPDFFNIQTSTKSSVALTALANSSDRLWSSGWSWPVRPTVTTPTINDTGTNIRQFVPISIGVLSRGIPYAHLSLYSNLYITTNNLGSGGDNIQVGGDMYAYLPGDTISFVVKKE